MEQKAIGDEIEQALQTLTTTSAAVDDYHIVQSIYSEDARRQAWLEMRNNQQQYNAAYDFLAEAGIRMRFDKSERRYVRIVDL